MNGVSAGKLVAQSPGGGDNPRPDGPTTKTTSRSSGGRSGVERDV
jgi:hypothetical protein